MRGLLFLQASVGWGLGLRVVQPQENFNTAGRFVLNIEIRWEPGAEQWMGMLEKTGSSPGRWGIKSATDRDMGFAGDMAHCCRLVTRFPSASGKVEADKC